jgi:superoxide dismutase, Cu-Zn family
MRYGRSMGAVAFPVTLALVLVGGALLFRPASVDAAPKAAAAGLQDTEGGNVGEVKFLPRDDGKVTVRVNVQGLQPGWHGIHIHTTGTCDPDSTDPVTGSPFFSAGSHWNPEGVDHGQHPGDIPPLFVNEDGKARASYVTDQFKVKNLFDDDGSAVILHSGPDNLAHIPATGTAGADRYHSHTETDPNYTFGPDTATRGTGDAGARFACGVVARG